MSEMISRITRWLEMCLGAGFGMCLDLWCPDTDTDTTRTQIRRYDKIEKV